ncbi:MAG: hypothetical protein MI749_21795 [Desulfovibrionales bacterium]|nr:hypothetical protein [Desulfovibrionales bacterium]
MNQLEDISKGDNAYKGYCLGKLQDKLQLIMKDNSQAQLQDNIRALDRLSKLVIHEAGCMLGRSDNDLATILFEFSEPFEKMISDAFKRPAQNSPKGAGADCWCATLGRFCRQTVGAVGSFFSYLLDCAISTLPLPQQQPARPDQQPGINDKQEAELSYYVERDNFMMEDYQLTPVEVDLLYNNIPRFYYWKEEDTRLLCSALRHFKSDKAASRRKAKNFVLLYLNGIIQDQDIKYLATVSNPTHLANYSYNLIWKGTQAGLDMRN